VTADAAALTLQGSRGESDADLLAAAIKRDAAAFTRLVTRYHTLVYRVVWRTTNGHAEAEDIAQEAFLKLWNNPSQVRDATALKSWLLRVATNLAVDWFRQKPLRDIDDHQDIADGRENAEEHLSRSWVNGRIDEALRNLPERQRTALALFHFEQVSQAEAAAAMDLTINAFESLLSRARRSLKDQLSNERHELLAAVTEEG
jgi:RNA polymerase sigma-70 factor, ECF subfamily